MSITQKIYERDFTRQLRFVEQFTDCFALPDASVLYGGLTLQGRVGVGFNTPNAVIHFVDPHARFNEEEIAAEMEMKKAGKVDPVTLIEHRAKLDSPSPERLQEILAESEEMNEANRNNDSYVTALESHADHIAEMFNGIAAQYNEAIKADASKNPLPARIASADGTSVHVDVRSLGKLLQDMPQVGNLLKKGATDYTKAVYMAEAGAQIDQAVDGQVAQTQAVRKMVEEFNATVRAAKGDDVFERGRTQQRGWANMTAGSAEVDEQRGR